MSILQIRTNAPTTVKPSDIMGLADQTMVFVGNVVPKVMAIVYFVLMIVLLVRIVGQMRKKQYPQNMELIGLLLVFGLMK